ncbi:MAG: hypothetical protein JHC95_02505 [Solirubrobacteraceae bacterium]|nr:hypothetical protein [Solirubrobacteraceae bacterium]
MFLRGEYSTAARARALAATVVAITALSAGSAHAAVNMNVTVSPSKVGTPAAPKAATFNFSAKITGANVGAADGSGATKSIEAKLPYPLLFNPVAFPSCTQDDVRDHKCSSSARIGSGKVVGGAAGGIVEQLKLTAYNGKGYRLFMLIEGTTPLRIDSVLTGKIQSGEEPYGISLLNEVPENLQQPVPGVFTTVTEFSLKVDAKKKIGDKTVGFVNTAGCSGGKLPFEVKVTYRDDKSESGKGSAKCSN